MLVQKLEIVKIRKIMSLSREKFIISANVSRVSVEQLMQPQHFVSSCKEGKGYRSVSGMK